MEKLELHINYTCPLKCRYCIQRLDPGLLGFSLSKEEMVKSVGDFLDFLGKDTCRVNISGGEPLLKYEDILFLMEHFPNCVYEISTSGYLLTREKAETFSRYAVSYVLSVDGGESVTKYLRPTVNGKNDYFSTLTKNIPDILYYAPMTRAKLIVSKNLISEVYNTYLQLERLGFKSIFITPNVYENGVDDTTEETHSLSTGQWTEQDWAAYRRQMQLITNEIKLGIGQNFDRCLVTNITLSAANLLFPDENTQEINTHRMICAVFDGRYGDGPSGAKDQPIRRDISLCGHGLIPGIETQEQFKDFLRQQFRDRPERCPRDPNCRYYSSCIYTTCVTENIKAKGPNVWIPSPFQCETQKIYHDMAGQLIIQALDSDTDASRAFQDLILQHKEEANGSQDPTTFLPR